MNLLPSFMDSSFEGQFDENFFKAYWKGNPDRAIALGEFEFAERMVVPDAKERAKAIGRLNKWLSQLHRFDPSALNEASRGDWYLLDNAFEAQRWAMTEYRAWEWNPALYNIGEPFSVVMHTDYAPLDERLRALLTRLADVSSYYSAAKLNLVQPTREHTLLAIDENQRTLEMLRTELPQYITQSTLRDNERALFNRRIAAAGLAIDDYVGWLKALNFQFEQRGAHSFRLGKTLYEQKFAYAIQTGSTAESLYRRAQHEKEVLHERMGQLADSLWLKYFPNAPPPTDRAQKISRMIARLEEQQVVPKRTPLAVDPMMDIEAFLLETHTHPDGEPLNAIRTYLGNDITLEGWSTYNQLVQLEAGGNSPETWLMYSLSALNAACDTILDYSVHVLDMSEADATHLMTHDAFLTPEAAQRRWRHVQLTSVQLVANFAGYSEIYDLREQLKHDLGPGFDLARFNEQFQSYGCAPVKVIKNLMRPSLIAQAQ